VLAWGGALQGAAVVARGVAIRALSLRGRRAGLDCMGWWRGELLFVVWM